MSPLSNQLFPVAPSELFKGDIVFYASGYAVEKHLAHLFQLTQVVSVTASSVILDNGRKFSLESGEEITRSSKGQLYPYTHQSIGVVNEAQAKLPLLNDVRDIDFSILSAQQLRMILDVARGAFTQVTAPTPCGGCGDKVEVSGINIDLSPLSNVASPNASDYEVSATIGFNDATYELTPSEIDALHEADDEDDEEEYDDEYGKEDEDLDEDDLEDRIASGHTV